MPKDFSTINTENRNRIHDEIQQATSKRKPRKTYSAEEAAELRETGNTRGRKGVKMRRFNLSVTDSNYQYIAVVSRVMGIDMSRFIDILIEEHRSRPEFQVVFEQAKQVSETIRGNLSKTTQTADKEEVYSE